MDPVLYGGIFFVGIFFLYYIVNQKFRATVLFISSLFFAACLSPGVALFTLLFTILNYFLGILLEKFIEKNDVRLKLFWFSISINIGILAFFKYFNFFSTDLGILHFSSGIYSYTPYLSVMIPIGISYYTFQTLGYLIRINRRSEKAEHNFAVFATYLMFFPKFLSGPVERSNHFLPQLHKEVKFEQNNVRSGARLFLWGLFKKIVIADNLFGPVSEVYSSVHDFSGPVYLMVLIVQTIYIYCDFSGYTDMALGLAKLFGIKLMDNFNRPFMAKNISDFWRRWHISLSSWCNDFIYNPFIIKYRRFGNSAVVGGIFLTFFIVGIWHGANWTFVILGLLQGVAIVYEFYTKKYRVKFAKKFSKKVVSRFSRIVVFLFMAISMVFFFSNSIGDAWYLVSHLFSGFQFNLNEFNFIKNKPEFIFALFCFFIILLIEIQNEKGKNVFVLFQKQPVYFRWIIYVTSIFLIYIFYTGLETFYYMRF